MITPTGDGPFDAPPDRLLADLVHILTRQNCLLDEKTIDFFEV